MSNFFNNVPKLSVTNERLAHLSPEQQSKFCSFGAGPVSHPPHTTILSAIEHSACFYPTHTAATVVAPDGTLDASSSLSYAELDRRANSVAAVLTHHGITNGDTVCLFLKRSVQMLVGILATLKVGACYVPQHVGVAPPHQLQRVANACKTRVVLTLEHIRHKLPQFGDDVTVVSVEDALRTADEGAVPPFSGAVRKVLPEDRCYVIFTSGTTGAPKGVQVTHGNVTNVILTQPMDLGLRPGLKIAQLLSIAFDMGAWEILGALSHASTLLIRDRDIAAAAKHADVIIATPTVLASIPTAGMDHVSAVAVAGEPCPRALAAEWGQFCTFYNACGPTEVTIVNTAKAFDPNELVLTIGRPTPNNTAYVLDCETGAACEIGAVGEMWGGGLCVSDGYLDNQALTDKRFVDDPFVDCASSSTKSWKMYRTGDLGRWNEHGELVHLGRVDDQVKVKGFRVELDGVSSVAERTYGVQKAVVLKVAEELVAWVTPQNVPSESVRESVRSTLPYYCVPANVIGLHELPKTSNGKVDKPALLAALKTMHEGATAAKNAPFEALAVKELFAEDLIVANAQRKVRLLEFQGAAPKMWHIAIAVDATISWVVSLLRRVLIPPWGHV